MKIINSLNKKKTACAKIAISIIETEMHLLNQKNHTQILIVTNSSAKVSRVLESCAVDDLIVPNK